MKNIFVSVCLEKGHKITVSILGKRMVTPKIIFLYLGVVNKGDHSDKKLHHAI